MDGRKKVRRFEIGIFQHVYSKIMALFAVKPLASRLIFTWAHRIYGLTGNTWANLASILFQFSYFSVYTTIYNDMVALA